MRTRWTLSAVALVAAACSTIGETGRSRLALFPDSYMWEMGAAAYQEVTASEPEITSGPQYEMVQRVGRRIAAASGHPEYEWEFSLLDAPNTANAFCLPGGKVAVYTGILPITQTEDGLAVVVGHEIAHATAEHGNERMTQQMIANLGLTAADLALETWGDMGSESRAGWMAALGMGAEVGVLLPYSRTHESEADEIGLRYLVRAGYDPWAAPALWERMAAASSGDRPPELMSTHPDPESRAARLRELIPKIVAEESGGQPSASR